MVIFKTIKWKNFLSTGNSPNEIILDGAPTTLIVGENGSGKSTLLDAITFVLFGKPFRNINKGQLLNSVNQKQGLVEVEFNVGKKSYKVIRGIKPTTFEIYQNGVLINQDSTLKDYQALLEDGILKLNYKSFTQIVMLGSAIFVPFMQLPSGQRREIIEELLDIKIFSAMNRVLKDKSGQLHAELYNLESEIEVKKQKTLLQKSYIVTLQEDRERRRQELKDQIQESQEHIKQYSAQIEERHIKIAQLNTQIASYEDFRKIKQQTLYEVRQIEEKLIQCSKHLEFYSVNDNCPTCSQEIKKSFRNTLVKQHKTEQNAQQTKHQSLLTKIQDLETSLTTMEEIVQQVTVLNEEISQLQYQIQGSQKYIDKLNGEITELKVVGNIEDERKKLQDYSQEVVELLTKRTSMNEARDYHNVAAILLKDTGIKTKIIRQYLPIINKLVNKYLNAMDLFISFELDEAFNESIKSRFRDEFTYASFSEGEKQRINLALLFAWRAVASIRNTTNTNLLLFDEILDGSLDASAIEYFLPIVKEISQKTNVFVITHKSDLFVDKFDRVLRAKKMAGYSVLDTVEK